MKKKTKISLVILVVVCLISGCILYGVSADIGSKSSPQVPGAGVLYNVRENPLYNKRNVAPAINAIVKKMKPGDKLFLQEGTYGIKETVNITDSQYGFDQVSNLSHCEIDLQGTYIVDPNVNGFLLDGDNINIKIGNVTTKNTSDDYLTAGKLADGITIRESNYSEFEFGSVSGFDSGVRLAPVELLTGICYTEVSFEEISYCNIGLKFHAGTKEKDGIKSSWVNENAFLNGKINNCYIGFKAERGPYQIDEYNNNSFYGIEFKDIKHDAIWNEFASYNVFYGPSFNNVERFYVSQKTGSKANKFLVSQILPISKLSLYGKGDLFEGMIQDDSGNVVADSIITTNDKGASGTTATFNLVDKKTVTAANKNVALPLNTAEVKVDSSTSAVELTLDTNANYFDNSFIINVTSYSKPIKLIDKMGSDVLNGSIKSNGNYKVTCFGNTWGVIKLSTIA